MFPTHVGMNRNGVTRKKIERNEFESLRDILGKKIQQDIQFSNKRQTSPYLVAEDIFIENSQELDLRMSILYNPIIGSKTINVHVSGLGPICRLDVDGPAHRPFGRSHKHSLQNERCPDRNLPDGVMDRPDLLGKSLKDVFETFCRMAHIQHEGIFFSPDNPQGLFQ